MLSEVEKFQQVANCLFEFTNLMVSFDIDIGGDYNTLNCNQGSWYVVPIEEGIPGYRFYINDIWYQDYPNLINSEYNKLEKTIKSVINWIGRSRDPKLEFDYYISVLQNASENIKSIDISLYEKEPIKIVNDIFWTDKGDEIQVKMELPPHVNLIGKIREEHLQIIRQAISLLETNTIQNGAKPKVKYSKSADPQETKRMITGIRTDASLVDDVKLKLLYNKLIADFGLDLKHETDFIKVFTGQDIAQPIVWPLDKRADLKKFLQGMVSKKLLVGNNSTGNQVPWKKLLPIFIDDKGMPFDNSIRKTSSKNYDDDQLMTSIIDEVFL